MKKQCLVPFFIFIGLFSLKTSAQQPDESTSVYVKNKVWIQLIGNDRKVESLYTQKGSIYSAGDSSLIFAKTTNMFRLNVTPVETIPIEKIWEIQTQKKTLFSPGGATVGAVLGGLIGGFLGYQSYKPCVSAAAFDCLLAAKSPTPRTVIGAIIGLPIGILFGGLLGPSPTNTIPIKGKRDLYAKQREKLKRLSITGQ